LAGVAPWIARVKTVGSTQSPCGTPVAESRQNFIVLYYTRSSFCYPVIAESFLKSCAYMLLALIVAVTQNFWSMKRQIVGDDVPSCNVYSAVLIAYVWQSRG